jgi:hypothetical protein
MNGHEVRIELLLGRKVVANDGETVGRIEEICAEQRDRGLVVTEYLLGPYAIMERLSVSGLVRSFLNLPPRRSGYRVPSEKLDLSDARHPRMTCSLPELKMLQAGA